jgi:signal transduction histidine kinase
LDSIDALVAFSRLATEIDTSPRHVLERLADVVIARAHVDAVVVVDVGPNGAPRPATARGIDLPESFSADELGEELEREVLARADRAVVHAWTLPLVSAGGLFGAVILLWDGSRPDPEGLKLCEALVDLAALAIDRAQRTESLQETLAELQQSREALARKEKLEALGQMAAVVAHEVKNPLASVSGALQVLGGRMGADTPEFRIVEMLLERVRDLGQMVDELLVFARPRAPVPVRVEVRRLFDAVANTMADHPKMHRLTVDIDVVPSELSALADPGQVRAVLLNLSLNAAQAMNHAGKVVLRARADGAGACLQVIDHGPGVPLAQRERIFEPFFTTKTRGSGLGLAVARQTAEAHGGALTLACPDGGGSVFTLRLPG